MALEDDCLTLKALNYAAVYNCKQANGNKAIEPYFSISISTLSKPVQRNIQVYLRVDVISVTTLLCQSTLMGLN